MPSERTSSGFGGRLRDARERRGVSLRQIADATKISVGVLAALERNDISKLPGGIFGRAFVRSYAIEVGLDPEATIQDFIAQFPNDVAITGHSASDRVEGPVAVESDRQTGGMFRWLVAICVPIVAGLVYFGSLGRQFAAEPPASPSVTAREADPPAAGRPPASAVAPDQPAPSPAAGAPQPAAVDAAVPAATTASAPADAQRAALPMSGDQLTVALTTKGPCWVSATVDGRKSIERLLQAGDHETLTVHHEMVLTAGDAGAIALQFNGGDARVLGKAGEVVTARFNPTNYKAYLQAR
jgi:cytoskeleton protein RodZ